MTENITIGGYTLPTIGTEAGDRKLAGLDIHDMTTKELLGERDHIRRVLREADPDELAEIMTAVTIYTERHGRQPLDVAGWLNMRLGRIDRRLRELKQEREVES